MFSPGLLRKLAIHKHLLRHTKRHVKDVLRPVVKKHAAKHADLAPALWDLQIQEDRLSLDGVDLYDLLQRHGSPLHVLHGERLERNIADFTHVPSGAGGGCEVYYSYKTHPVPGVLRFLHDRGVGAEVISPYELWLALELGVPPQQIIYNGPAKSDASIRDAIARDILLINFNHREEIARVAAVAKEMGKRPRVGLRVATGLGWSGQFGVRLDNGAALRAYEEALASPHLEVVGLHAHFGVQIRSATQLQIFVEPVLAFCDTLRKKLGLDIQLLDFGGSLALPTVTHLDAVERRLNRSFLTDLRSPDPGATFSIRDYVKTLVHQVEEHFRRARRPRPRLIVEPGRAMTGSAQLLLTSVITTKQDDDGERYAVLDAGINLADCVRFEYHQLFPVNRYSQARTYPYRLVGPICTPGDVIYWAWTLPELHPGDALAIMDSGAYFVPFATSFSFPQPPIVMLHKGKVRVLRQGESFKDLVALDKAAMRRASS